MLCDNNIPALSPLVELEDYYYDDDDGRTVHPKICYKTEIVYSSRFLFVCVLGVNIPLLNMYLFY